MRLAQNESKKVQSNHYLGFVYHAFGSDVAAASESGVGDHAAHRVSVEVRFAVPGKREYVCVESPRDALQTLARDNIASLWSPLVAKSRSVS